MAPCRSWSLAPETWGVIRTLGSDHSRPLANARIRRRKHRARHRANVFGERVGEGRLVDDLAAGDVDEHASRFIAAKRLVSNRWVVSGVHWQQTTTKSLSGRNGRDPAASPSSVKPGGKAPSGCGWRRVPTTRMPSAAQSLPTSRPMPPAPTTHAVFPSIRAVDRRGGRMLPHRDRSRRGGAPWRNAECRPPRIPPSPRYCPTRARSSRSRRCPRDRP